MYAVLLILASVNADPGGFSVSAGFTITKAELPKKKAKKKTPKKVVQQYRGSPGYLFIPYQRFRR